jgi:hypothetical protein
MASFTVNIPEPLKKKMEEHPEINWPEYLRQKFEIRIRQLKKFDELVNKGAI